MMTIKEYQEQIVPMINEAQDWLESNKDNYFDESVDWQIKMCGAAWLEFKDRDYMTERLWYDKIVSKFAKAVFSKDYEAALNDLVKLISKESHSGGLKHSIEYYADRVGRIYRNVDSRELADVYKELFPQ